LATKDAFMNNSKPQKSGSGFFSIDRRTWGSVCDLKDINLAVAYLTVACGTAGSTGRSSWSAKAIYSHTDMDRRVAGKALKNLLAGSYLGQAQGYTASKPRYSLTSWETIATVLREASRSRCLLTPSKEQVLEKIRAGQQPSTGQEIQDAQELSDHGWLSEENHYFSVDFSYDADSSDELIWLPNTLVTGTVKGEKSPVARLRATQEVRALRLLVDLYHSHDLPGHGGIRRDVVSLKFTKQHLGDMGSHAIWVFEPKDTLWWYGGASKCHKDRSQMPSSRAAVCDSFDLLAEMGLVYCVPHLFESDWPDSGLIHGCESLERIDCELEERELHRAARHAAGHMASKLALNLGWKVRYCAPVRKTIQNVEMAGIFRLRYRPQTLRTSEWRRQLAEKRAQYVKAYEEMLPASTSNSARHPFT
jgi:hypothetical protein